MKRIALFFLIACLCCSFVACDMGNGLVAELLGGIRNEYDYGYVEPPVDVYESEYVAIDPIEPWGTVEIETLPPMPETTEEYTVEEYWSEDVIIEPIEPLRQVVYSVVRQIDCEYISGCEIFTESLCTNNKQWVDPNDVTVEQGCDSVIVSGIIGIADVDDVRFGYSINGEGPFYSEAFYRDPDAFEKESVFKYYGADYVSEYQVTIPLANLPAGSYEIKIWYANYVNEALQAYNVEVQICIFNLEIAQPIMD